MIRQTGAIGYDDKQSSEERWAATGAVTLSEVVIYIYIYTYKHTK